jgi:hypothetical protein
MLKSVGPTQRSTTHKPDQTQMQGSNSMDDLVNLAQVKAELCYLNRLDEKREINVASLKRLKEARDALLGKDDGVEGASRSQVFRFSRNDG